MPHLVATKSMRYATRRLLPGDEFVAKRKDAKLLTAVGKAAYAVKAPVLARVDLTALRQTYKDIVGKNPFGGWDAAELQRRIDEASASS